MREKKKKYCSVEIKAKLAVQRFAQNEQKVIFLPLGKERVLLTTTSTLNWEFGITDIKTNFLFKYYGARSISESFS